MGLEGRAFFRREDLRYRFFRLEWRQPPVESP